MAFIGKKPTDAPLTSSDVADGIITSAKIADGTIVNADVNASAAIAGSKLSGAGISVGDQWRLNTDDAVDSSETDLDTGWERVDSTGCGTLGSAMTQSSGVFTFPSTGIYYVQFQIYYIGSTGADYGRCVIKHHDGSSTQTMMTDVRGYYPSSQYETVNSSVIFDCEDTSTDKIIFYGGGNTNGNAISGNTNEVRTGATFIRLGDT